jgi:hypothetical protein
MLDRYVDENIVPPKKIIDEYNYGIKITVNLKVIADITKCTDIV